MDFLDWLCYTASGDEYPFADWLYNAIIDAKPWSLTTREAAGLMLMGGEL